MRLAGRDDLGEASRLFGAAFAETVQWRWLIEDDEARSAVLPSFFRASLSHTRRKGRLVVAEGAEGLTGVAAWLPPGKWRVPSWLGVMAVPQVLPYIRSGALLDFTSRGRLFDGASKAAHPTDPHWYLAGIAVSPAAQGGGIGSQLLREGLAQLAGSPVYLECAEELAGYYERFGFQQRHRIDPGAGAPVQLGMWKPA